MNAAPESLTLERGAALGGEFHVPGDKSITHRALILAAMAAGESDITGALDALDTRATAAALAALGAGVDWPPGGPIRLRGTAGRWRTPPAPLDLGNSGTGLRLLAGALAGRGIAVTLTGDASLRRRPMERIAAPLAAMGADIGTADGRPPIRLLAGAGLRGIRYRLPVASAQVKSAVLCAALGADGETRIVDPFATRDHTERLLPVFGASVACRGDETVVKPGELHAAAVKVPGDFSAAAFLIAAALVVPGSEIVLRSVGVNPTRTGLLPVLGRMGAAVELCGLRQMGTEPLADLRVRAVPLHGTEIGASEIPALIDELPVLMVLATLAQGPTVIEGAGELRHKESDRIASMQAGLAALGAGMEVVGDRIALEGGGLHRGGRVSGNGDHRVAMALAVAGLAAPAPVTVADSDWIATSFPGFAGLLAAAGARIGTPA